MEYLPVNLDVKQKNCCVVGGGAIAKRKAELLVKAQAIVHIIAPSINEELKALAIETGGSFKEEEFYQGFAEDAFLLIVATNDQQLNEDISVWARAAGKPVNVVDHPELCSFILPAIIDRSPVIASVSSSGRSPVLARLLRTRLEAFLPANLGTLADFLGVKRNIVKSSFSTVTQRKNFWEQVVSGPVSEEILAGRIDSANTLFDKLLHNTKQNAQAMSVAGEVYLVGAGPGDPDLLTFRALRLLQQSDVVLYDRLVSEPILDLARRDAEKIYVGKTRDNHPVPQEAINELLVKYAKQGKRVCRLKGGDPFIFGRGGEEITTVAEQGIPFQVVPGITAASGCASYAGVPLTHRDYSQSVRFVTGHLKDGAIELDWESLVSEQQTIVFYMGLVGLEKIMQQLILHGMDSAMPVALIEKGTTKHQRVLVSTVSAIAQEAKKNSTQAPTIIIVGQVVQLRDKLNWFGNKLV